MLSALFLGLAASGTSACTSGSGSDDSDAPPTFYCTDRNEIIVDDHHCDDDRSGLYFLAFGAMYAKGLRPGTRLPAGGKWFPASDKAARASWGLPTTGRVTNGTTVRTGIVGTSGGATGTSGTSSGS